MNDIESKDQSLRQVVGDSYRDLISSADAIESIAQQCETASQTLEDLLGLIVRQRVVEHDSEDPTVSRGHDEEVFTAASCVKFIVDSQETIYRHVDRHEYLMAGMRYLKALEMHKEFEKSEKYAERTKQFPFLEHMWPSVKKLDGDIWNKGQSWLAQQESIDINDVASVLACFALLRPVDGMDLLKYFLTARHDHVVSKIHPYMGSIGEEERQETIVSLAQKSIESMWDIVCIVFDMFSDVGPRPIQILLEQSRNINDVSLQQDQKHSWFLGRVEDAVSKLESSISQGSLQLESEDWLLRTSRDLKKALEPWLLSVDTCLDLKRIDNCVHEALSKWTGVIHVGKEAREMSINSISPYATGNIIDLWELTCQSLLIERAKAIMKAKFARLNDVANRMVKEMEIENNQNKLMLQNPLITFKDEELKRKQWWVSVSKQYFEETSVILDDALNEALECMKIDESKGVTSDAEQGTQFEEFISQEISSSVNLVVTKFGSLTSTKSKSDSIGMSLAIVHFTSMLLNSCDPFEKLLHFQDLSKKTKVEIRDLRELQLHPWARATVKNINSIRDSANIDWATWCSEEIVSRALQNHCSASLSSSGGDGDETYQVPTFPSKWLIEAITCFCAELDQSGGIDTYEDLIKQAMETFKNVTRFSAIKIENDSSSKEMSRQEILQRIFDLKFINILFWEDKGISSQMKGTLQQLISRIDPVEWSEFGKDVEANVFKYATSAASLLRLKTQTGCLAKASANDHDVFMDLATSQSRFAYLPAKIPSKSQMTPSYGIPTASDGEDSLKRQDTSISSSAQNAITSLLGTKAAEVGGLLGSFNFPSFTD